MIEVHVNFPSAEAASATARSAVERHLAAAANIHAPVHSHYWWDGGLQSTDEVPVVFKTSERGVDDLMAFIADAHPYQTPGIVAHRPERAWSAYETWIEREVRGPAG